MPSDRNNNLDTSSESTEPKPFCDNVDFVIRSTYDDVHFDVQRSSLLRSEIFRDMFACCNPEPSIVHSDKRGHVIDLHESAHTLQELFDTLHQPPPPPDLSAETLRTKRPRYRVYEPSSIPLATLTELLTLSDKYLFCEPIVYSLHDHLLAHAPAHPLEVYGLATRFNAPEAAIAASTYLLDRPLSSYSKKELCYIPTVEAYHDLVRLQAYRTKKTREILLQEDIFPHGYGVCPVHKTRTLQLWNEKRIELASQLDVDTNVGAEMRTLTDVLDHCPVCEKSCIAASEMLNYKCDKIPKSIDRIPME